MKEQFYFNLVCNVYFNWNAIIEAFFLITIKHKLVTNIKVHQKY